MKPFQFRLQRLLDLKRAEADSARIAVANALRELADAERRLVDIAANRQQAEAELSFATSEGWEPHTRRVVLIEDWLSTMLAREALATEAITTQSMAYEEARGNLEDAECEAQGLERIRSERHEEWRIECDRLDSNEMAEIATTRFIRSQPDNSRSDLS